MNIVPEEKQILEYKVKCGLCINYLKLMFHEFFIIEYIERGSHFFLLKNYTSCAYFDGKEYDAKKFETNGH